MEQQLRVPSFTAAASQASAIQPARFSTDITHPFFTKNAGERFRNTQLKGRPQNMSNRHAKTKTRTGCLLAAYPHMVAEGLGCHARRSLRLRLHLHHHHGQLHQRRLSLVHWIALVTRGSAVAHLHKSLSAALNASTDSCMVVHPQQIQGSEPRSQDH